MSLTYEFILKIIYWRRLAKAFSNQQAAAIAAVTSAVKSADSVEIKVETDKKKK